MINIYLAAPIVGLPKEIIEEVEQVKYKLQLLQKKGEITFYDPKMHQVPNAWGMTMGEWARCIFVLDVVAIDNADWVVVCDYGRKGTAGTAWEAGYAFGKNKKILIIEMAESDTDYSVMMRGCCSNYCAKDYFIGTNTDNILNLFVERGRLAQIEELN